MMFAVQTNTDYGVTINYNNILPPIWTFCWDAANRSRSCDVTTLVFVGKEDR